MSENLVFIPQRGFMPARALGTGSNVIVERDGMTFTGAVFPDRDGTRVAFSVEDIAAEVPKPDAGCALPLNASSRVVDDQGRALRPRARWITGGNLRDTGGGMAKLLWTLILESPAPDARHLVLTFDGPAGDWTVRLPLERVDPIGTPARAVDATDTKNGVTFAARAVARTGSLTAVELEAYLDPPSEDTGPGRRYVLGIGPTMCSGRLCSDQVILRDERGGMHLEVGRPCDEPVGGKRREAVTFPALGSDVQSGTIEVDVMWVQDGYGHTATVPLPGETEVSIAGCDALVVASRTPGVYTEGRVRVEFAPKDPEADRQLVFCQGVDAGSGGDNALGMQVEHCFGKTPIVSVPEPTGTAREVTVRGPVIQYRGPWRLDIPLESI